MIVRLLLPLVHLLPTGLEGLSTGASRFPDHFGHLCLFRLEKFYLVVPRLFLIDNRWFLRVHLALVLECLRLHFRRQHLSRCRRAEVYIIQLVLVLVLLPGQELHQARVSLVALHSHRHGISSVLGTACRRCGVFRACVTWHGFLDGRQWLLIAIQV